MHTGKVADFLVERRHADAAVLGLGPAAAEEIRSAGEAVRLRASLGRLIRLNEILSLDDADRGRGRANVRRAGAARQLLAACAVTEPDPVRRHIHVELHTSAE